MAEETWQSLIQFHFTVMKLFWRSMNPDVFSGDNTIATRQVSKTQKS